MKEKFIQLYMNWAREAAGLSHAIRLQVGAVVVKDDTVISYGYNGMPAGWDNECETQFMTGSGTADYVELITRPEVLHAESNAIAKLARSSNSGLDADIFITHSPCMECAKLIFQSGIKRVFYAEDYRSTSGIDFLRKSNIEVIKVDK